jgi:hypothetical protein
VGSAVPFHCTWELLTKFDPMTVTLSAAPPAVTLVGETDEIAGTGLVLLPPDPELEPLHPEKKRHSDTTRRPRIDRTLTRLHKKVLTTCGKIIPDRFEHAIRFWMARTWDI